MSPVRRTRGIALGIALAVAAPAAAQVRHRRPFAASISVNYHFDNNRGAGCQDYNCGGRCYDGHSGTDFSLAVGTAVLAGADGVVVALNNGCPNTGFLGNTCGGGCGNYVQLEHADGSRSTFCHMQLNSLAVTRGQRVRCGEPLGRSASSGNSTGPHLHFGWKRSASASSIDSYRGRCSGSPGAWVDPRTYPLSPEARCACEASPETCNGRDDDCDGTVDDGLSRSCYPGPAGTAGRGVCRPGTEACAAGAWGTCAGAVLPRAETCNQLDDDCDGTIDDGACPLDGGTGPDAATPPADAPLPRDAPLDRATADDDSPQPPPPDAEIVDLGPAVDDVDVAPDRVDALEGGCSCHALPARGDAPAVALALAAQLLRRRRVRRR
jgi:hypothetical protein